MKRCAVLLLLPFSAGCVLFSAHACAGNPAAFFLAPSTDAKGSGDGQASEKLFDAACEYAKKHATSNAYRLAYESLHLNPQLAPARKLLGYVKFRNQWRTPFEVRQLSAGKVWTDRFGWLSEDYVQRYAKDERYFRGRWMSAETEARLRADINQGWRVESEHYSIVTNRSLEAGVELSQQLEMLHEIWTQAFAGYVIDDAELVRRFDGKPPRSRGIKQHSVVHYKTRDEYIAALRKQKPGVEMSLGCYFDTERTTYFFAGDEQDVGTVWHEATHQLFSESRPTARDVGRRNNFWVIEAVACYMESLLDHTPEGYVTLGEPHAGRLPAARERLLEDHFYVPLAELVAMGMDDLQADSRIARIYSQSAGLATFFLQTAEGKYREAFVGYLRAVYDGRADETTLARLVGPSYADLDAEYQAWMRSGISHQPSTVGDATPIGNAAQSDP